MRIISVDIGDFDRLFYPVVPLIVLAEHEGVVDAMVATWWASVSYNPPRLAVSIAPERLTYRLIAESGRFGVSAVSVEYFDRLLFLGDFSGRFLRDKVERSGFTIVRGSALGVPMIGEAYASAELKVWRIIDVGDHDLVIGDVVAVYGLSSFKGVWRIEDFKPILYLGRVREPGLKRAYIDIEKARTAIAEVRYDESLMEAREARRRLLDEVSSVVETSPSLEEAERRVVETVKRYGLDERDARYLLKEALKRLKTV
ncbi:MAG: flavin reductase family protein [Acidilobaceae archaeon]